MGEIQERNEAVDGRYPLTPVQEQTEMVHLWRDSLLKKVSDYLHGVDDQHEAGPYNNVIEIIDETLEGLLDDFWVRELRAKGMRD